jgi:hypothetical protein
LAKRDYYEVLGVDKSASEEEIKKVKQGQKIILPEAAQLGNKVAVQNNAGKLQVLASIVVIDNKVLLKPEKVFNRE